MPASTAMGLFGVWVLGVVTWHALNDTLPDLIVAGTIGLLAVHGAAVVLPQARREWRHGSMSSAVGR